MLALLWSSVAMASDPSPALSDVLTSYRIIQDEEPATAPAAGETGAPTKTRPYLMEVNMRGRYMSVPDSILDIWYFNGSDDNGAHLERPQIRAYTVGLEFAIRNDTQMGAFYFDYFGSLIKPGYWDDVEAPGDENYLDGDWVEPTQDFGIVAFGINYYYDMRLHKVFSIVVGAGLGGAYIIGDLQQWDGVDGEPAYKVREDNPDKPPDDVYRVPTVVPILDINAGVKFHINERANIRIEGGLHDLLYVGGAVGVVF